MEDMVNQESEDTEALVEQTLVEVEADLVKMIGVLILEMGALEEVGL
jgi:hypothetical protein